MPRATSVNITANLIHRTAMKVDEGRTILRDVRAPGLRLVVTPKSARWSTEYKLKKPDGSWGGTKVLPMGVYPDVGIDEARDAMREVRRQLEAGHDPALERKAKIEANRAEAATQTVADAIDRFIEERHQDWTEATYRAFSGDLNFINRAVGELPMARIRREHLQEIIDDYLSGQKKQGRDGRARAVRISQLLQALWRQASIGTTSERGWDWIPSPEPARALTVARRNKMTARNRVLTLKEVRGLWPVFADIGPAGHILRLSLVTGMRVGALCRVRFADLDLDPMPTVGALDCGPTIRIPAVDGTKATARARRAGEDLVLPLSSFAVALFREAIADRKPSDTDWLFVGHKANHFSPNSVNQRWRDHAPADATPHDLRRTMRTWLGETDHGGNWADEELLIGHKVGNSVSATYDYARRTKRLRPIAEAYGARLHSLVSSPAAEVVRHAR